MRMAKQKRRAKSAAGQASGKFLTRQEMRVERFILKQIDEYIRLHKEHEKDLRYIG
jgi:hypothetical protein